MELRALEVFHAPPEDVPTAADAWMAAVETGTVDPDDADAEAAFVAQWNAAHGGEAVPAWDADWEPVTEPPPRRGGEDHG